MDSATRFNPLALFGVTLALALSLALAGVASAAPIGKDGKLHACYRVKGKPKGAMRVVRSAKARCLRGERKVSWILAGAVGAAGAPGEPGASGANGVSGVDGSAGAAGTNSALSKTELEERITALTARVDSLEALTDRVETLEGVLQGVSNEALTEALAAVAGLSNPELLAAVNSVPVVETLCDQATALTEQTGALGAVIEGLSLNGILTGLGGLLDIPELPDALPEFSCG